jgi:hypothetical protein
MKVFLTCVTTVSCVLLLAVAGCAKQQPFAEPQASAAKARTEAIKENGTGT